MNVFSFLVEAASRWPHAVALQSSRSSITFSQLLARAESLRDTLITHGVRPGMGVSLIAHNGPEFIIGLFAGLGCEAVVMPIAPDVTEQELNRALETIPVAAIIHDGSLQTPPRFSEHYHHDSCDVLIRPADTHCKVAYGVPRAAVIRFTSGTTGSSKGVVLSHSSVSERTAAARDALNLSAGDRVVWVLPMAYHFVVSILTYVRFGTTIVLPEDSSPKAILEAAAASTPKLIYGAPDIIDRLARDPSSTQLPEDTVTISTSTGISHETLRAFTHRFGRQVRQVYGLIEVGLPIGNLTRDTFAPESVGAALPSYEVAVLDPQYRPLPPQQVGKLAVRGPGMFDAYLAPYRPREEVLTNGWFLTGDLATQAYDGSITVCGREKSVIHSQGEKVFPEEVEGVINSFPGIRSSRVFGFQQANNDEHVVAEIEPRDASGIDIAALNAYAKERLSPHKVPARFVIVKGIPTTRTGKVRRTIDEPSTRAPKRIGNQ